MIKSRLRKFVVFTNWDSKEVMENWLWFKGSWFQFDSNWEIYPSQYSYKNNPVGWKAYIMWRTYRAMLWYLVPFWIMTIMDLFYSIFAGGDFITFRYIGGEFSGNNIWIAIAFYFIMFWSMKNALLLENAYFYVLVECSILGHKHVMKEIGNNPKNHQKIQEYKADRAADRQGFICWMLFGALFGLLLGKYIHGGGDAPKIGEGDLRL